MGAQRSDQPEEARALLMPIYNWFSLDELDPGTKPRALLLGDAPAAWSADGMSAFGGAAPRD